MENSGFEFNGEEEHLELPPGFRFHPTDEELISHYLSPKALDVTFTAKAVGEVDLNKAEPWDLPKLAKMGEHEWYFFSVRDKKYPNGLRTNRATDAGYWKATGKDKEVHKGTSLVGLKKTLVFYIGRAPKGEKSNWIMHEYRLSPQILPSISKSEWVICRIYHKSSSGRCQLTGQELPTLSETSPYIDQTSLDAQSSYSVPSFDSTPTMIMNTQGAAQSDHSPMLGGLQTGPISPTYNLPQGYYPPPVINESPYPVYPFKGSSQYQFGVYPDHHDHQPMYYGSNLGGGTTDQLNPIGFGGSMSQDTSLSNDLSAEISSVVSNYGMGRGGLFDDQAGPSTSLGPIDIDSIWNF